MSDKTKFRLFVNCVEDKPENNNILKKTPIIILVKYWNTVEKLNKVSSYEEERISDIYKVKITLYQ